MDGFAEITGLPAQVTAGDTLPRFTVTYKDKFGNLTDSAIGAVRYVRSAGVSTATLSLEAMTRVSKGVYEFVTSAAVQLTSTGTYNFSILGIAAANLTGTTQVQVQAAQVWAHVRGFKDTITAGTAQSGLTVVFRDVWSNPVEMPVNLRYSSIDGSSSGTITLKRYSTGVSTATATVFTEAGDYTVELEPDGLTLPQAISGTTGTQAFTVMPAGDYRVSFENVPPELTAGIPIETLIVRYYDKNNNPTDNSLGRITYVRAGGSSTATVQALRISEGVYAVQSTTVTLVGNYTFSVAGIVSANQTGNRAMQVAPAALEPVILEFLKDSMQTGDAQTAFRMTFRDRFGNPIDRETLVTFTNNTGSSSGTITVHRTAAGVSTATVIRFYLPGLYHLTMNGINSIEGASTFRVYSTPYSCQFQGLDTLLYPGTHQKPLTITYRDKVGNVVDYDGVVRYRNVGKAVFGILPMWRSAEGVSTATITPFYQVGTYTLTVDDIRVTSGTRSFVVNSMAQETGAYAYKIYYVNNYTQPDTAIVAAPAWYEVSTTGNADDFTEEIIEVPIPPNDSVCVYVRRVPDIPLLQAAKAGTQANDEKITVQTRKEQGEPEIELLTATPNPFQETTVLSFVLPEPATIKMEVIRFNRRISELVNGRKQAGRHTVTFNPRGNPSGVYLVRLVAINDSGVTVTKTMNIQLIR